MPPHFFDPHILIVEPIFTLAVVIFCFLIYFKTKESYDLTKYKGIGYFRDAFLFFGLSYVLRFFFSLVFFSTIIFNFISPREIFAPFFIFFLGYFSTIGIFYLIFSLIWKKFNNRNMLIFGHCIAVLLSAISFITGSHMMIIYLQCILLAVAVVLSFVMHIGRKKVSKTKLLYLLVSGLWLLNLFVIDRRKPFSSGLDIFFEAVSLIVFVIIYHKILKWIK